MSVSVFGQDLSNLRQRVIAVESDTISLDSLSIVQSSFVIEGLPPSQYMLDAMRSVLILRPPLPDSISVEYRVFPFDLGNDYYHKDTTMIVPSGGDFNPFVYKPTTNRPTWVSSGGLNKSGSISRGIAFGNSQDLSVNSTLSLQLSGRITDEIEILASITDDNIPIQPEGNTSQLQDFDQVYIQLFNRKSRLTAGDFQIRNNKGYYLNYFKRAQGATFETNQDVAGGKLFARASAAVSKGKFARNIIQGIEGNQGPYRLTGAENETFIIVLAGTERVFIDGKLLTRGQEYDYVIDYNSAQVTFMPGQRITKDRRIVVEFQYSDKNYARSLIEASVNMESEKYGWFINAYGEQDSRNQPLQLELSDADRAVLSSVGDNIQSAIVPRIDSIGFNNNQVLYALVDSLGYDSVFVYSTDPELAHYALGFGFVGAGIGDYIESDFTAVGNVYEWIAPDTVDNVLVHNGTHLPVTLLATPKKKQMVEFGGNYKLGEFIRLRGQGSVSNFDENTFSAVDDGDNVGLASLASVSLKKPLGSSDWSIEANANHEYNDSEFRFLERFRAVEFERNWNILGQTIPGNFNHAKFNAGLSHKTQGFFKVGGESLTIGSEYAGYKAVGSTDFQTDLVDVKFDGSVLSNDESEFIRHKAEVAFKLPLVKVGFRDEHERNRRGLDLDSLTANSYQFYDWTVFAANPDSSKNFYEVYFRRRSDRRPLENSLSSATEADETGIKLGLVANSNHQLKIGVSQRELRIRNPELVTDEPESTLLGRVEHNFRALKGVITSSTFYEVGSGLEQKREFIYLEVPAGQGVYVWIDYDEDGVKDLNEFEIAQFQYEANYIRTFVPSAEFVKTFTNQFSQVFQLNPARAWAKEGGIKKFVSRFSDHFSIRTDRKTNNDVPEDRFNPFLQNIADTSLVTTNTIIRNTLSFNRNHQVIGVDYTIQNSTGKNLLSNGFEGREFNFHQLRWKVNFLSHWTLLINQELGQKAVLSDFLSGRNYDIDYWSMTPSVSYQPTTAYRLSLKGDYSSKSNVDELGGEQADLITLGIEGKWNRPGKGSVQGDFNLVDISYDGSENNSLSFEMLEGLNAGRNYTWSLSIQQGLSKNMQLNILYNGRKSDGNDMVHSAGVQVRAFF